MSDELARRLAALSPGEHLCLVYETSVEERAVLVTFFEQGLRRGERCLYVGPRSMAQQVWRRIAEEARRHGALDTVAPDAVTRRGKRARTPEAMTDFLRRAEAQARAEGAPGLRIAGDVVRILGPVVRAETLIAFETNLDEALADSRAVVLCQYDRRRCDAAVIQEMLRTHPVAVLGAQVCPNPYYEPPELIRRARAEGGAAVTAQRVALWIERLKQARAAEREHERIEHALHAHAEQSEVLARRLVEVQEEERRHLARELHDEIGQGLTTIAVNLEIVGPSCDTEVRDRIHECLEIVRQAIEQLRGLALDLRPAILDDLGLVAALRWLVDRQARRAGLAGSFVAQGVERPVRPGLATTCFRIAQEALTNVFRHARATHFWVRLRQTDAELQLTVRDDGVGFDPDEAAGRAARGESIGLLGIRERVALQGGQLNIESRPSHGTIIVARFPFDPTSRPALTRG